MIKEKIINGVKVFEHEDFNIILLDDQNIEACFDLLESQSIKILSITSFGEPSYKLNNLDALGDLHEDLEKIIVTSDNILNWTGLYNLKSLKILTARWLKHQIIIDFSRISGLKELVIDWHKEQENLFNLKELQSLRLWNYQSKKFNLEEFRNLAALNFLDINQSNIRSLKGIEFLPSLTALGLGYNNKLEVSTEDFKDPFYFVEKLDIESCKKINSDFVKVFPNLKSLRIMKQSPITSLKDILEGLPKLEEVFISGTKIEEKVDKEYYKHIKNFFIGPR